MLNVTVQAMPFVSEDSLDAAKSAGLRYVMDSMPGIRRCGQPNDFYYVRADGERVSDEQTLQRIRKLAIPPAYSNVWICTLANGHLQATGRDAKGRKQYRYHARWREVRDETKYGRMVAFAAALPRIRERVAHDLSKPGLPREKVLAAAVKLLESTLIRVGNDEYAKHNGSFGLTTLRNRHVDISGSQIRFSFRGKSGKEHSVAISDRRLAAIVKRCRDLPGHELFQYVDDNGDRQTIDSDDVNSYLRDVTSENFSAKDFRTWAGTVYCVSTLQELGGWTSETEARKNIVEAVKRVAARLGNTASICRKCYVHPLVLEAYLEGTLNAWLPRSSTRSANGSVRSRKRFGLRPHEAAVARLLRRRLKEAA